MPKSCPFCDSPVSEYYKEDDPCAYFECGTYVFEPNEPTDKCRINVLRKLLEVSLKALNYVQMYGSRGEIEFNEDTGKSVSYFVDDAVIQAKILKEQFNGKI